jgi:hypothetical protein
MTLDRVLRAAHSGRRRDVAVALDQFLVGLLDLRERYDARIGELAAEIQRREGWRDLGFSSFAELCENGLGLEASEVERLADRARRAARLRSVDVRGGQ